MIENGGIRRAVIAFAVIGAVGQPQRAAKDVRPHIEIEISPVGLQERIERKRAPSDLIGEVF